MQLQDKFSGWSRFCSLHSPRQVEKSTQILAIVCSASGAHCGLAVVRIGAARKRPSQYRTLRDKKLVARNVRRFAKLKVCIEIRIRGGTLQSSIYVVNTALMSDQVPWLRWIQIACRRHSSCKLASQSGWFLVIVVQDWNANAGQLAALQETLSEKIKVLVPKKKTFLH